MGLEEKLGRAENIAECIRVLREPLPEEVEVIITVKRRETEILRPETLRSVVNCVADVGGYTNYISELMPYVAATIPTEKLWDLRKKPEVTKVSLDLPSKFHALPPVRPAPGEPVIPSSRIMEEVRATSIWNKCTGKGVRIAMVDSGIDKTHPMFVKEGKTKVVAEKSFVKDEGPDDLLGHGTFTSSYAAGYEWTPETGLTLKGAAPDALLINAKAGNKDGKIKTSDTMKAMEWAVKPKKEGGPEARILSCSFGRIYPSIERLNLIREIRRRYGAIFVVSSGNAGPATGEMHFPGGYREVISVGSLALETKNFNDAATFSSRGPGWHVATKPDFLSPSGNLLFSTVLEGDLGGNEYVIGAAPDNESKMWRGTSFSCPAVSGIVACLLELHPKILIVPSPIGKRKNNNTGFGLIDALELYNLMPISEVGKAPLTVQNYDPWIIKEGEPGRWDENGVFVPTPYFIEGKQYIYYADATFMSEGTGLVVYEEGEFKKKGKILPNAPPFAGLVPGIVNIDGIYYAFHTRKRGDKAQLCVSSSSDGIEWKDTTVLIEDWKNHPTYRIGVVYRETEETGRVFLYSPTTVRKDQRVEQKVFYLIFEVERREEEISFEKVEEGVALDFTAPEGMMWTYRMCAPFAPYAYHDGTKFVLYLSGPSRFRPWRMLRCESNDGKSFETKKFIEAVYKDYNYYDGLCTSAELENKYFFSTCTNLEQLITGVKSRVYKM